MRAQINLHCGDNMPAMREMADDAYELAIVDPPYGIGVADMNMGAGSGARCSKIENRKWCAKGWDDTQPTDEYFRELRRVSCVQVIWGGNYFRLPPSQYFAVWDKGEGMRGRSFAEGEYAWVSAGGTRIFQHSPVDKARIHPTQKPVALYKWLLSNYANPGDRILDTHLGSASIAIACWDAGYDLDGWELDADYYAAGVARLEKHKQQGQFDL